MILWIIVCCVVGLDPEDSMSDGASYNDSPIDEPSRDRFGIDPFAKTLAASIQKLAGPEGTVIALNGPWGSGKSSAVNLVRYHLKDAVRKNEIAIINFACWWFRGEEALALAFFRELYAGLGPKLGDRFRKALPKLGARLLRAGSMVGAGVDLAGGGGAGAVTAGAMNWLSGLIESEDSVERLHAQLAQALTDQNKRFLIVIDDIDRLSPDEALLIFRLVKSVGRLPNVIYLLVFDRLLAEAIVKERFPSEGPHYLEKIIQAGFDLPEAGHTQLCDQLLNGMLSVCGQPSDEDGVRFMNIFYDVVAPEIRTPRDVNRLLNALAVTWPAIGQEVDQADFVGLETLRLLRPGIYRTLRSNKQHLCGEDNISMARSVPKEEYDRIFLSPTDKDEQERLRRMLMRLFPPLERIWSNVLYGRDSATMWSRQRRACSSAHFDAYFRFSLGDETLTKTEIDDLVKHAGEPDYVEAAFKNALGVIRSNGATKAALLLDELNLHADKVAESDIAPLLKSLFKLADVLDVPSDVGKAFSIASNSLRLHWLLRRLTLERFKLAERSALFLTACKEASLAWLVDFAESAYRDYHPRDGSEAEPEEKCLTTSADADSLRAVALTRLRETSKTQELSANPDLPSLLFRWREFADDGGQEVRRWTEGQLESDAMVVRFAQAFTSHSWSQGMGINGLGDRVARRNVRAAIQGLETIIDKERFRARVEALAASTSLQPEELETIGVFLEAWRRHDKNPRD